MTSFHSINFIRVLYQIRILNEVMKLQNCLSYFVFRHENEKKQAELKMPDAISRKILVLGAGMVSSPLIEYHTRKPGTNVTVGMYPQRLLLMTEKTVVSELEKIILQYVLRYRDVLPFWLALQDI